MRNKFSAVHRELAWLMAANLLLATLGYLTTVKLANTLGATEFGEYVYFLLIGTLLSQVISFGTEETATRTYLDLGAAAVTAAAQCRALLLGAVTLATFWVALVQADWTILLVLAVALQGLSLAATYEVIGQNRRYSYVFMAERTSYLAFVWALIILNGAISLEQLFGLFAICTGISLLWQTWDLRHLCAPTTRNQQLQILARSLPVLVFSLSKNSYGAGIRILLKSQLGAAALGVYAVAWQFVPLFSMLMIQVTKVWRRSMTGAIAAHNRAEAKKLLLQICLVVAPTILVLHLALDHGGELIVSLLFSDEYSAAAELLPLLPAYFVVVSLDVLLSIAAVALRLERPLGGIYLLTGVATVAFLWLANGTLNLADYLRAAITGHGLAVLFTLLIIFRFGVRSGRERERERERERGPR